MSMEIRRSSTMFNSTNSYPSQPNSQPVLNDLSSFEGSSWSILAAQFKSTSDPSLTDSSSPPYASQPLNSRKACESMKLKKDDIPIYGLCPARDQFFVTNCDHCGQVVKYQALSAHIELRHSAVTSNANSVLSNIETPPPSTRSDASSGSTSSLSNPLSTSDNDFCPISSGVAFNTGPGISSFSRLTPSPGIESPQPVHLANSSILGSSNLPLAASSSLNSQSNQATKPSDPSQSAACGTYNSGSEGISLLRASPSSLKSKFPSSTSRSSSPNISINSNNTQSGKGKSDKKEKLLPCKDRQYDPDKHCGVKTDSMDKECTRSLTCKTHSLTLRRQVTGRVKSFDDLLEEHRRSKDEALRLAGKEPKLTKKQLKQKEQEAKKAGASNASKGEKDAAAAAATTTAASTATVNVTTSVTSKTLSSCSTSSIIASPSPLGSNSSESGDSSPKVVNKANKSNTGSLLLQTALSAPVSTAATTAKLSLQSNLNARIQKKREIELANESSDVFVGSKRTHLDANTTSPKPVMNSNCNVNNVAHGTNSPLFSSPSSNVSITSFGLNNNNDSINSTTIQVKTVAACNSSRLNAPLIVKSSHLPSPLTAPIVVEGSNDIIYLKHPPRPLAVNSYNCRHLILSSNNSSSVHFTSSTSNSNSSSLHVDGSLDASLITSPLFGRHNDRMYTALSTVFQLDPKSSNKYSSSSPSKQQQQQQQHQSTVQVVNNFTATSNSTISNGNNNMPNAGTISMKNTSASVLTGRTSAPFTSVPLSKLNTNTTPVALMNALTGGVSGVNAATATKISLSPSTINAKRSKGNLQNQPTFTPICQLTKQQPQQEFVQPASVGQSHFNQQQQTANVQSTSSSILINSTPNLSQALFNRSVTTATAANQSVKRKLTPLNHMSTFFNTGNINNSNNNNSNNSSQLSTSTSGAAGNVLTPPSPVAGVVNANSNSVNSHSNGPKAARSLMGLSAPSLISLLESGISNSSSSNGCSTNNSITGNSNSNTGLVVSNTPFSPNTLTAINSGLNNNITNSNSVSSINSTSNMNISGSPFISSSPSSVSPSSQGLLAASLSSPLKKVKVTNNSGTSISSGNNFTSALSTPTLESLLDAGIPGRSTSTDTLSVASATGLPSLLISSRDSN